MLRKNYIMPSIVLAFMTTVLYAERPADFGMQWVKSHPYTVSAVVLLDTSLNMSTYSGAGMNKVLGWENREYIYRKASIAGVPWHIYGESERDPCDPLFIPNRQTQRDLTAYYINRYNWEEAIVVWDEAKHIMHPYVTEAVTWAKTTFPTLLVYTNVNAGGNSGGAYWGMPYNEAIGDFEEPPVPYNYELFLEDVVETGIDVLCVDAYPYIAYDSVENYINNRYFYSLEKIRQRGLLSNIPYWAFIQTFSMPDTYYLPSESDLRMQIFTSLAYGFTGLHYFVYHHPDWTAILNGSGTTGTLYPLVADVSAEILNIGEVTKLLTSTDVRYIPGKHLVGSVPVDNTLPVGTAAFDSAAGVPYKIIDIQVDQTGTYKNGMIGFFRDWEGKGYFMLVNVNRAKNTSSAATALSFTLNFDSSIQQIYRLNRDTGIVETVPVANGVLQLTLPGGTGDLFKVADPYFAGFYPVGDLDKDKWVNFKDLAILAEHWLECTAPESPCNYNP
ncbi:MAG: hypothetical protein ACYC54_14345 [Sedimentisphaerales bacterium]